MSNTEMYLSQDQARIDVDTMSGPWMTMSVDAYERDVTTQSPGAGAGDVQLAGRGKPGNITLTKMYNAATDVALEKQIESGKTFRGTTVTATFIDEDGNAIPGAVITYPGCIVISGQPSDYDANGSDPKTFTVVLARKRAI